MSITMWESEEALNPSVERANQMREQTTDQADGSISRPRRDRAVLMPVGAV